MKAKLIISIDDEPFEEVELDFIDNSHFSDLNQDLKDYRLQSRCTINEKRVRQAIGRSINNAPLKYALGKSWSAVLTVPSRMNEIESLITSD